MIHLDRPDRTVPTALSEIQALSRKFLNIDTIAFETLFRSTYLPDTVERQICYLAILSQDDRALRSAFTEDQEYVFIDTAKKVATTDGWLRYGYPLGTIAVGLNATLGIGATVAGAFCLPPASAAVLSTIAATINCGVATVIQPVSWFSTGTAPNRSAAARDRRQDTVKKSEDEYEKIAAKIIQLKFECAPEEQEGFKKFIGFLNVTCIEDRLTRAIRNSDITLREVERHVTMISNAKDFILTGALPIDTTLNQEVRLNQMESRPQTKHARAHRASRS